MKYSLFQTKSYQAESFAIRSGDYINVDKRVVRIWNSDIKRWCDIHIRQDQGIVMVAKQTPSRWSVITANTDLASVEVESDNPFDGVGNQDTGYILGDLLHVSPISPVKTNTNLQKTASSGPEQNDFLITDPRPNLEEKDYVGEPEHRAGMAIGESMVMTDGKRNMLHIGNGVGLYADSGPLTEGTQNKDYGGGMFTNSLNFLQHYLIPLAQSAGLHIMPHVINLPKYIGIGNFIRNIYLATQFTIKELRS